MKMQRYLYEAILEPNELGGFDARFPELGIVTQGNSLSDAVDMAQDMLGLYVSSELKAGHRLKRVGAFGHPVPAGGRSIGVMAMADAGSSAVETMTVQEAADMLDVSRSRIYALINDGILRSTKAGNMRLVLAKDVMARFNEPRKPGRPRKAPMEA